MANSQSNNTKELTTGFFVAFKRTIKKLTIGAVISLLSSMLIRFIEIAFGFAWEEGLTYLFLSYCYLIATTANSVYVAFKGYYKGGIFYIIGWALGSLLLFKFNIINLTTFYDSLIIPVTVFIITIIFRLLLKTKKRKEIPISKIKRKRLE